MRDRGIIFRPLSDFANWIIGVEYHIVLVLNDLKFRKHVLQSIPAIEFLCQETVVFLRSEAEEVYPFSGSDKSETLVPWAH